MSEALAKNALALQLLTDQQNEAKKKRTIHARITANLEAKAANLQVAATAEMLLQGKRDCATEVSGILPANTLRTFFSNSTIFGRISPFGWEV
jgi:hypothetical protein